MDAYQAALADDLPREIGAARTKPGSINALVVRFYSSARFTRLAPLTRSTYRNIIERFRTDHGNKAIASLKRDHVRRMIDARATTPAAANHFLGMIGALMRLAVEIGWREDDPTYGIKKVRVSSSGFHSWTEAEIAAFEARHPVGTKARLAFDLLLYTAQRRGDVVRMGRQHLAGGFLTVRQHKTGAALEIPIHTALSVSLAAAPGDHLAFLTTAFGKPYTAPGFGNWFRERCDEAGLPECSAHGLRKAAARRLAEAGCSAHQIMAITGHKTPAEAERYTRAADQRHNARAAFSKLTEAGR
jgi:integrase